MIVTDCIDYAQQKYAYFPIKTDFSNRFLKTLESKYFSAKMLKIL